VNAECVVEGLKRLKEGRPLIEDLLPPAGR
jgi:hypothetical protein